MLTTILRYKQSGERRYKISLYKTQAKYVFLLGKVNSVIVSVVLLGFFTDRNDAFLPFDILQLVKSLLIFIPEA